MTFSSTIDSTVKSSLGYFFQEVHINISIEHLGNMERGQGKPSLELLVEIALYFNVSTDYLLLGRELDRDSVRASLLELSAQMTELASKL